MPIYTKFGDKGKTALIGGGVVPKDDPRVEAYGAVDELNAMIGLVLAFSDMNELGAALSGIQNDLFTIGVGLASKGAKAKSISPMRLSKIEAEIDHFENELPPLNHFIIPGGSKTASLLHLARTVCRRAERNVVSLSHKEAVNPDTIIFLNRLGDLLFVLARYVNYRKKIEERIWKGR
jgi:cob(I)alamin adenosyltransferase